MGFPADDAERIANAIDAEPAESTHTAYASAWRPGDISALDLADVVTKPTDVLVAVRRSKTDQDAHGQLVGVGRGEHRQTDPIRTLDA